MESYAAGFRKNPLDYSLGLDALRLCILFEALTHLASKRPSRKLLEGGLRWSLDAAMTKAENDCGVRLAVAELRFLLRE
jgi:hypothetical protein